MAARAVSSLQPGSATSSANAGRRRLRSSTGPAPTFGNRSCTRLPPEAWTSTVTRSRGGDAAGDTLSGFEQVMGSGFADTLTGDAGANALWGLAGNDVLTGAGGADVLKGGAGADTFRYVAAGDSTLAAAGRDTITDFATGDKIDLSAIDANGVGLGDAAFTFGTGAFTAAGQIRVLDFGGGRYGVYLETTGNNTEDALITVYSDHALTAADFVL